MLRENGQRAAAVEYILYCNVCIHCVNESTAGADVSWRTEAIRIRHEATYLRLAY